jgi:uncharacterized GH25 family protein
MMSLVSRSAVVVSAVLCAAVFGTATASAHFVWIETSSDGKGTLVRAGFGEAGGWDPDLIEKIKNSRFWTRAAGGDTAPLAIAVDEKEKEYRTKIEGPRPAAVLAATDYGVIQFGKFPPSWLRYTSKHLTGAPGEWNDKTPTKDLRVELLAEHDGDAVKLQALFLGKPLADATIKGETPDGKNVELKTDAEGRARWPVSGAGLYSCFVGATTETPGELAGKKYEVLKDYAALNFRIGPDKP